MKKYISVAATDWCCKRAKVLVHLLINHCMLSIWSVLRCGCSRYQFHKKYFCLRHLHNADQMTPHYRNLWWPSSIMQMCVTIRGVQLMSFDEQRTFTVGFISKLTKLCLIESRYFCWKPLWRHFFNVCTLIIISQKFVATDLIDNKSLMVQAMVRFHQATNN